MVRFHETLFLSSWWLERIASYFRARKNARVGCSGALKTAMSIAPVVYTDRLYAVSIRSILTATYFSSLTSFLSWEMSSLYPAAFQTFVCLHLSPTGENTRQLNCRTSLYNNVQRIKIVALSPGIKCAISQPLYELSTRNLLRKFIGLCMNEIRW